jgi:hypothetical protein
MRPSEFIATRSISNMCCGVLSKEDQDASYGVLIYCRKFIGDRLDDIFPDMNDDAVCLMLALESFLVTFVQHCIDLEMTQKFIDSSRELH